MATRIKGQEVEVILLVNNEIQDTITDVRSFEMSAELDILTEGYLGEKTMRKDDIFNGVKGKMELHFENADVFKLMRSIAERAKSRTPGVRINVKATLNFPDGDRPIILIEGVFFGAIPMTFGSRSEYGTLTLDFEGSDFSVISS